MVLGRNLETGEESGYTYNALDRRVKNVRKSAGIIKETEFVADYISGYRNDLMEYGPAARNVHGRGYELLSKRNDLNPEGKTHYHADFYGSPLVAVDGEGNFKWYAERGIWGNLKERKGTREDAWGDSLRFTAYPYDPVAGKHFAYARVYDGTLGRMYAKDPVKQGLNGYLYCDNDPADYTDPDGELAQIAVAALGGAGMGFVSGLVSSAVSQRMRGEKFSFRKAFGAAAEGAVTGAASDGIRRRRSSWQRIADNESGSNTVNPKDVNFMQSSIKNQTGEYTVLGNAEALRSGALKATDLPEIRIWQDADGKLWTLDHRRLASFRIAELDNVPFRWATDVEVANQMWKMTTKTNGTSVKLKLGNGQSMTVQ